MNRVQKDNVQILKKRPCIAYKYSNKRKGALHEAVLLAGRPVFLKYENRGIKIVDQIEETTRVIEAPHQEHYTCEPYEFEDTNEVLSYMERARKETFDSLFSSQANSSRLQ